MPKIILRGKEARAALVRGMDFLVDSVKVTLGPQGRLVCATRRAIGQSPMVTKDGCYTANNCDPIDPCEQIGSDLTREAAQKTVEHAGDGTTTACVLTQAMVHAGMEQLEKGIAPAELERGIKKAVAAVVEALDKMVLPADGERLAQVATISANGDQEIGRLVHEAIKRVGKDGVMTCEESRSLDTTLDVVDGMQIRQGFRSPHFINDPERLECIFENALILLWEGKIESPKSLIPLLKLAQGIGKPLLTIAGDYDPNALATLAIQKLQKGQPLCAIRADAWGPRRTEILRDIAVLTGGIAITEDLGKKLDNVTEEWLGQARRIVVNEYRTTIIDGAGRKDDVQIRADEIRRLLADTQEPDKAALLRARLAGLVGGIAVIRSGGATESEMRERKDRIEDALYATKAAAEEGIVVGGGQALQWAAVKVIANDFPRSESSDIVFNSCLAPKRQISLNADLPFWPVKLDDSTKTHDFHIGIDVATRQSVNLYDAGIIDPVKVVKEALANAASVACTILRTECVIADLPEPRQ